MHKDITSLSLSKMTEWIQQGKVSSVELVQAHLARIEGLNPSLNAVVQIDRAGAIQTAEQCDLELAGGMLRGPLHGVPVTLKDTFEVKGLPAAAGTLGRAGFIPDQDATVAARLREAGAILMGKTNTPEMGLAIETDNLVYGRTANPYDHSRSPGGSSGGPCAAVAAGLSPLDIGTDGGGSIRIPAHYCGVAALKATTGRISAGGHFPPPFGPASALVACGPIARSVFDLALVLPLISGSDPRDPAAVQVSVVDPSTVDLAGLRIAYFESDGKSDPDDDTVRSIQKAVAALREAGATIKERRPPRLGDVIDLHLALTVLDFPTLERWVELAGTRKLHPWTAAGLNYMRTAAEGFSNRELSGVHFDWAEFKVDLLSFMQDFDCLVSPVSAQPALPHGEALAGENFETFAYSLLHNLTGWPVAVVRVGESTADLPIAIQVAAAPWHEHVALKAAAELELRLGGWRPPPLPAQVPSSGDQPAHGSSGKPGPDAGSQDV